MRGGSITTLSESQNVHYTLITKGCEHGSGRCSTHYIQLRLLPKMTTFLYKKILDKFN